MNSAASTMKLESLFKQDIIKECNEVKLMFTQENVMARIIVDLLHYVLPVLGK